MMTKKYSDTELLDFIENEAPAIEFNVDFTVTVRIARREFTDSDLRGALTKAKQQIDAA